MTTATESRTAELDSIAAKARRILAEVDRIRTATADLGPNDWRYTGRGAELHDLDRDLSDTADAIEHVAR